MMTMKRIALLAMVGIIGAPAAQSAPPPSEMTKDRQLWIAVGEAADKDLGSIQTMNLLDQYLKSYSDHLEAGNAEYMLAERLFKREQFKEASVAFEKFVKDRPKSELADSAYYRLGECYYNLGVYNSAEASWHNVVDRYRKSALYPNALENLGILHIRNKDWGRADEMFNRILRECPQFTISNRIRQNHGIIKYFLGEYPESAQLLQGLSDDRSAFFRGLSLFALKLFEDSVASLKDVVVDASGPYAESAAYLRGEGFYQKQNYNLAYAEFENFAKRYPSSKLISYARLRQAAAAFISGEREDAIDRADRAMVGGASTQVIVHGSFIKAIALLELQKYEAAAKLFTSVTGHPDYPDLCAASYLRLAWAHKKLGQTSAMENDLRALEEKFPSSKQMQAARFLQGASAYEAEKWEDAGARFEQAIIGFPYSVLSEAAMALMTVSYTKANRLDHLVTAANSSLKLFEKNYLNESAYWRAQSYFFIGKAFYELKRFKEATPYFEKVTINYNDSPLAIDGMLLYAWSLVETGDNDKARQKAQVLLDNPKIPKPIQAEASFLKAATLFNAKDYDKALLAFTDYLKQFPGSRMEPRSRYLMGLAYHQKKVFGSAIDEWKGLIKNFPNDPLAQDAYLHIGDLYFKAGDYAKASEYFRSFREKWPASQLASIAMWQELQAYFNAKDDETAIHMYPVFLEKYPTDDNADTAKKQMEMVYYRRGADGKPDKLSEFLAKYPKSPFAPAARYKLGEMAIEQKAWNRAVVEMEQFAQDYPTDRLIVDALFGLGLAYESSDQPDKAVLQYRNIMSQFAGKPGAVDAAFRLGSLHFKAERFKEALDAFTFASTKKSSPDLRTNIQYNIALCAEALGRYEEASAAYAKFAGMTKNQDQKREALLNAGLLLKKAEKNDKSIPLFVTLLKDPGDKDMEKKAIILLAEAYTATSRDADAIKTYERLLALEPAGDELRITGLAQLAYLHEKRNEINQAMRVYEKIAVSDGKPALVQAAKDRVELLSKSINAAP